MSERKKLIRDVVIDVLKGAEKAEYSPPSQFGGLAACVTEIMIRRGTPASPGRMSYGSYPELSPADTMILQEVFWDLFREGVITLGMDAANPTYPWFRVHSEARLT